MKYIFITAIGHCRIAYLPKKRASKALLIPGEFAICVGDNPWLRPIAFTKPIVNDVELVQRAFHGKVRL